MCVQEFIKSSRRINCKATKTPCSPISQISSTVLLVTVKQQRSWLSKRTTNNRSINSTAVVVDSQVVNCNRISYQQVNHSLRSLQAPFWYLTYSDRPQFAQLSHPKSVYSETRIGHINKFRSGKNQARRKEKDALIPSLPRLSKPRPEGRARPQRFPSLPRLKPRPEGKKRVFFLFHHFATVKQSPKFSTFPFKTDTSITRTR